MVMVGTCNGLLCLCDNMKPSGAIFLINPVTRESLAVPPLPSSGHWVRNERPWFHFGWDKTYSFAYHPVTVRYSIVHLPFYCDQTGGFNAVKVFTLGEASWREVPTPGARCWVTKDAEIVMSLDLEDERVASAGPLPAPAGQGFLCHLTVVSGKLGLAALAICAYKPLPAKTEVWVLGGGKDRHKWSRYYSVQVHGVQQRLARPHFAHGKFVLTTCPARMIWTSSQWREVFGHRLRDAGRLLRGEVRSLRIREPGTKVLGVGGRSLTSKPRSR